MAHEIHYPVVSHTAGANYRIAPQAAYAPLQLPHQPKVTLQDEQLADMQWCITVMGEPDPMAQQVAKEILRMISQYGVTSDIRMAAHCIVINGVGAA
jgi:hypothetical protein